MTTCQNMIENRLVTSRAEPPASQPADLAEAARQLHAIVEALPPTTARDRATARRIEGAAVALDLVRAKTGAGYGGSVG